MVRKYVAATSSGSTKRVVKPEEIKEWAFEIQGLPGAVADSFLWASKHAVGPLKFLRQWEAQGASGEHLWPYACFAAALTSVVRMRGLKTAAVPKCERVEDVQLLFETAWRAGFCTRDARDFYEGKAGWQDGL